MKLVLVHEATGLDRVIRVAGGTLKPTKLLGLDALCSTKPHWALQISSAKIASRDHSRANCEQSVIRNDAHCGCKIKAKTGIKFPFNFSFFSVMKTSNLRLHLYKCNWYMVMGMLIGRQKLDDHQFGSPMTHSLARRSNQFVALNGMELVDSCK